MEDRTGIMDNQRGKDSSPAPAATQTIRIVEYLSSCSNMASISEIARGVNVNNNMVFRVLKALEQEGWVYADLISGKYQLTLKPVNVVSAVSQKISLTSAAAPYLHELWQETGESTWLGILHDDQVFYLQHLDSVQNIKVAGTTGGLYPAAVSAPGRVLLAWQSMDYLEEHIFQKKEWSDAQRNSFLGMLQRVKSQNYALDNEDYGPGIICYAAPVRNYTGTVVAAVGCSGALAIYGNIEIFTEMYGHKISETARKISGILGSRQLADDALVKL